jgi:hypothetical protein
MDCARPLALWKPSQLELCDKSSPHLQPSPPDQSFRGLKHSITPPPAPTPSADQMAHRSLRGP